MTPKLTTYIYPWDVARGGIDAVLDELTDCGITGLNLTSNYHAISALWPRGEGTRLFLLARGAVLFPARAQRYGRIKPAVYPDREITDAWTVGATRAIERGFSVSAWAIGMFAPWIAQDYPSAARIYVTGDRNDTGICPNSPDVQEYLAALYADLADQVPIDKVILEGLGIPAWNYGWVRPRVLAEITPVGAAVLRLCFCESCLALASNQGLDVDAIRKDALGLLGRFGIRDRSTIAPPVEELFAGNDQLMAYALIGCDGADAVTRAIAGGLRAGGLETGVMVPAAGEEIDGTEARVDRVRSDIVGLNVFTSVMPIETQRSYLAQLRADDPALELSLVIGPPLLDGAPPVLITPSFDYSDPNFFERIEVAQSLTPTEISIYHYGLLDGPSFRTSAELIGGATC